ncbi:hypothetical protein [Thalassomonas actiniarum]|uniref:Uncharacterized protein n=1 Tax=Thalassomonas actiniarum TaxID=485447 RepID=A0AAF0C5M8_9GAMM|nr:hypothetical protein [Thalassomonas actiniarum]WDE01261.1 hypothetical protein SG35_011805 [Thalassomonas actiniarum]
MIDKLRLLALKVQWFKGVALVIGLASLALIAYILIGNTGTSQYDYLHIPSVIALLWSALIYWLLYTFPGVPDKAPGELGFFKRLAINFKRFLYSVLAIVAFATTAGILVLTIRGLSVWLQSYG